MEKSLISEVAQRVTDWELFEEMAKRVDFKVLNSISLLILPLDPISKRNIVQDLTWISRALASSPTRRFLRGWFNSVSYLQIESRRKYEKRLNLQSFTPGNIKKALGSLQKPKKLSNRKSKLGWKKGRELNMDSRVL
jgi:hypothetical protein